LVIAISFNRNRWLHRLPESGIDPVDMAQECLRWVEKKSRGGMGLKNQLPLCLLAVLYTSLTRYVLSALSESRRRSREITATDYYCIRGSIGDRSDEKPAQDDAPEMPALAHALNECEDYVIGSMPITGNALGPIEETFRYLRDSMRDQHCIVPHRSLPHHLREHHEVSLERHAYIAYRLNRFVREFAQLGG
jgi:hypothetical protein